MPQDSEFDLSSASRFADTLSDAKGSGTAASRSSASSFQTFRRARLRAPMLLISIGVLAALPGCSMLEWATNEAPPIDAGASVKQTKSTSQRSSAGQAESKTLERASSASRASAASHAQDFRAPLQLPDLADAPTLTLDQSIRVRFHEKALRAGAPKSVPPLRAMVLVDPRRISAVFTAMGLVVWRIDYTAAGLKETRHPKLDPKVEAARMLRDLMFVLWPLESVRAVLPKDAALVEDTSSELRRRTLTVANQPVMRVLTTKMEGRSRTTLVNNLEGYTLSIESIDAVR